mmetsp:Transcript_62948/g.174137  ORF Transcript_62948/g.174137 Transcript_62948/m.174137 type:complete len:251 (-) Transcript_62948:146-898(-)
MCGGYSSITSANPPLPVVGVLGIPTINPTRPHAIADRRARSATRAARAVARSRGAHRRRCGWRQHLRTRPSAHGRRAPAAPRARTCRLRSNVAACRTSRAWRCAAQRRLGESRAACCPQCSRRPPGSARRPARRRRCARRARYREQHRLPLVRSLLRQSTSLQRALLRCLVPPASLLGPRPAPAPPTRCSGCSQPWPRSSPPRAPRNSHLCERSPPPPRGRRRRCSMTSPRRVPRPTLRSCNSPATSPGS